jgi:hypothetical protein
LVILKLRATKPQRKDVGYYDKVYHRAVHLFILSQETGEITSDVELLLIRQADNSLQLTRGIAGSRENRRDARYADHDIQTLVRQRIYQIVAGYEDCSDANLLRRDPAPKAACDRLLSDKDLASQPTLSRLENAVTSQDLYRMG